MIRRAALLLTLLGLCAQPLPAAAQDDAQYRRIGLADGTTVWARILVSDDNGMKVITAAGERYVPWEDVVDLVEIEAAEYGAHAGSRLAYVSTWSASPDLARQAQILGDRFLEALAHAPERRILGPAGIAAELDDAQEKALKACALEDPGCVAKAAEPLHLSSYVFGLVEPLKGQLRASFVLITLDGTSDRREVSVEFQSGELPSAADLLAPAWKLLGLDPSIAPVMPAPAVPEPVTKPEPPSAEAEPEPVASAPEPPPREARPRPSASEVEGVWMPVPGAPALSAHRVGMTATSVAATGLVTGLVVYAIGGVGLGVPWDEEQAQWADPLFLTSVGVASYLAGSWVSNHIVARALQGNSAALLQVAPGGVGVSLRF